MSPHSLTRRGRPPLRPEVSASVDSAARFACTRGSTPVSGKELVLTGSVGSVDEAKEIRRRFVVQVDEQEHGKTKATFRAAMLRLPSEIEGPSTCISRSDSKGYRDCHSCHSVTSSLSPAEMAETPE